MKMVVLDVDRFVSVNELQRVTTPTFFEADGGPTAGGLFSTEIFGRPGSRDRSLRWGYIDLGGRFLHPLVYKTCTQLDRKFGEIVSGSRYVIPGKTGLLTVDETVKGAVTGIDGLYSIWKNINWGSTKGGGQRVERIECLNAIPIDLAFITKWHVMPALYRDVETTSTSGIREIPPINNLYVRLLTSAPTTISGLSFADGSRKLRAQDALYEIHRSSLTPLAGKKGLIQDRLLGRYNDYSVRGVLSGPALAKADHPGEQEVPFGTVGVPLYLFINVFQPYIIKSLTETFRPFSEGQERFLLRKTENSTEYFELPPEAKGQFGADLYKKWIAKFMRSQSSRLEPLTLTVRGKEIYIPLYDHWLGRKTTLLDLFYIQAMRVNDGDKHVMFTRYPVEDFRACHFAKAVILTTELTEERLVSDKVFDRYPVISGQVCWIDSFRINNSYTKAMGADYDGDTFRLIGLYTQEANRQAAEMIKRPTNFCDGQGLFGRQLANEAVLTLFAMSR